MTLIEAVFHDGGYVFLPYSYTEVLGPTSILDVDGVVYGQDGKLNPDAHHAKRVLQYFFRNFFYWSLIPENFERLRCDGLIDGNDPDCTDPLDD